MFYVFIKFVVDWGYIICKLFVIVSIWCTEIIIIIEFIVWFIVKVKIKCNF